MSVNGSRSEKNGWIHVSVSGTPTQIGIAHGYLLSHELSELRKVLKFTLYNDYGLTYDFFVDVISSLMLESFENRFSEYLEEIDGISEGAKRKKVIISREEILFLNSLYSLESILGHLYEFIDEYPEIKNRHLDVFTNQKLKKVESQDRCTGFMVVGNYTKDGGIVCGHNTFDNYLGSQYDNIMMSIKPKNGNSFIMQTSPGQIQSGTDYYVTDNGFIVTETTIGGFNKFILKDLICCRIRKAVQYSKCLDDYARILQEGNSGDYANSWLVGDTKNNEIMRVELGLKYVNVEKKKNGYFIGFNAPYDPRIRNLECENTGFYDIRRHQGSRRVRLEQLMAQHKGKLDVEIGKSILADHFDTYLNKDCLSSRTCCSHYDMDAREFMSQADRPLPYQPRGACDGIVCDSNLAKKNGMCAIWGASCGTPFIASEFCKKNIQWAEQEKYLLDRPTQPWTEFYNTHTQKQKLTKKNIVTKPNKKTKKRN